MAKTVIQPVSTMRDLQPEAAASPAVAATAETLPAAAPVDDAAAAKASAMRGKAKKVVRLLLVMLVLLLGWHVLNDRMAPSSSVVVVNAFTTQVAPRVAGEVIEVGVVDNQEVGQGDVLFQLDPRPFDLAVQQAEANLAQAEQTAKSSAASLASAEAQLTQARAQFETVTVAAERARELHRGGVSSKAQLDQAEAELIGAEAALQIAQSNRDNAALKAGVTVEDSPTLALAESQLAQARLNREFATVRAPRDGVITNLKLGVGQFVAAGSPSMTFIASTDRWIMADLRENQLGNVDVGDSVAVQFDAQPGRVFKGKVQSIAWGIDPGRTAANGLPQNLASTRWFEPARTIPVHVVLDEGDGAWPANVRVGSKASVLIYAEGEGNPIAWLATGLMHIGSFLSFLY